VRAAFMTGEGEDVCVRAMAAWYGDRVHVEADDPADAEAVRRVFRPTPLVVDDPAARGPGTTGPVQHQPGSLAWFRAAATVRGPAETGMAVRLDAGTMEGGFDPAANYRDFEEQIARLDRDAHSGS
jgi:hypothetical protein